MHIYSALTSLDLSKPEGTQLRTISCFEQLLYSPRSILACFSVFPPKELKQQQNFSVSLRSKFVSKSSVSFRSCRRQSRPVSRKKETFWFGPVSVLDVNIAAFKKRSKKPDLVSSQSASTENQSRAKKFHLCKKSFGRQSVGVID